MKLGQDYNLEFVVGSTAQYILAGSLPSWMVAILNGLSDSEIKLGARLLLQWRLPVELTIFSLDLPEVYVVVIIEGSAFKLTACEFPMAASATSVAATTSEAVKEILAQVEIMTTMT